MVGQQAGGEQRASRVTGAAIAGAVPAVQAMLRRRRQHDQQREGERRIALRFDFGHRRAGR